MKKTIITLLLIFSLSIQAQQQFGGSWTSDTSTHTTVIIASEYAVLKVFNFSFEEDSYIEEEITKQDNNDSFDNKSYITQKMDMKYSLNTILLKTIFIVNFQETIME